MNSNKKELFLSFVFAVIFILFFILLQKTGLVNLVSGEINYFTAILIGLIASVSTCMATVGGLVLSVSATFAKEGNKIKPQIYFHLGRLISFFILGGFIGVLGSAFTLTQTTTFIITIVVVIVMLILGLKLLGLTPQIKKFVPALPKSFSDNIKGLTQINHTLTPILVGIATFFLPCGFTQSMQIYTLSSGSFISGALTMFFFALGTLPVLAIVSFSSFGFKNEEQSNLFFKTAGMIVIAFAFLNLISALVTMGWLKPVFNL